MQPTQPPQPVYFSTMLMEMHCEPCAAHACDLWYGLAPS